MIDVRADTRVSAYLAEVRREVAAVDPTQADGIVADLTEHLSAAASDAEQHGEPFDVDDALSTLGDPAMIAAAVDRPAPDTGRVEAVRSGWARVIGSTPLAVLTLLLLAATMFLQFPFWIIALALLWLSPRWTLADKIVGSVASPPVLFVLLPLLNAVSVSVSWSIVLFAPACAALYLLLRMRVGGRRVLRVPRATPHSIRRTGLAGRFDRWPAAILASAALPFAVAAIVIPVVISRSWAGLPWTATIAAIAVAAGAVILSCSRGWSWAERSIALVAMGVTCALLVLVVVDVAGGGPVIRSCSGDVCSELAVLAQPSDLLGPVCSLVLGPAVFTAVWAAARFRTS